MKEKIQKFADIVTEQQRSELKKNYPVIFENTPGYNDTKVIHGKKYSKVDVGSSGKYMIDAEGKIFGIKAYGVIHRGHQYGTLDTINDYFWGDYRPIKK